jgi:aminoglycoside 6'-N-acetyltransferase I
LSVNIAILNRDDQDTLTRVAPGVFDHRLRPQACAEFLSDARHHIAVAIDAGTVVGMASGVHYGHPDKAPQLWINEVGVAPTHRNQGLGKQLLLALLDVGRKVGCVEAWVLTDRANQPAMRVYESCGGVEADRDQVMFTFPLG